MMNGDEEDIYKANANCKVCGENDFECREGFFYCNECGTKQDQVRAVHVETEAEFLETRHKKRTKIKNIKKDEDDENLTSWECYNYILRGLVEELLTLGAKEELKLMVLQLWAAYLRRLEVAFFNKKHTDLPKLGVKFRKRDAKAIYNHCQQKRLKRKQRRMDNVSQRSTDVSSIREYRKSKRKLDESVYSQSSLASTSMSNVSTSQNSFSSSTSGASSRAIQLKFSATARKYLKKRIPVEHLKKHEKDANGEMQCHSLHVKQNELTHADFKFTTLNIKQLYTIIAIALNLIGDDIQLSDVLRYIGEGHISHMDVLKYLPENASKCGRKLLHDIGLQANQNFIYTDKALRCSMSVFAKGIDIHEFKTPNLLALMQRYVNELSLPQDVFTFAERLFNLMPPEMQTRADKLYPHYEARAMAYIVFILKLLFGLDGMKETIISNSSKAINKRLQGLVGSKNNFDQNQRKDITFPELFVWDEWVEYIEMRKIIIAQYSTPFAKQFKEHQNLEQLVEELHEKKKKKAEADLLLPDGAVPIPNFRMLNIQSIFENLFSKLAAQNVQEKQTNGQSPSSSAIPTSKPEVITFQPSLTPAHSYLKRVLLHHKTNTNAFFKIPDLMHIDHSQRTLQPHLDTNQLSDFLKSKKIELKVELIPCTSEREYIGAFWADADKVSSRIRVLQADFDVDTKTWEREAREQPHGDELLFKTDLETYGRHYLRELELKSLKKTNMYKIFREQIVTEKSNILPSLHSIDVFNENNMDPLKHFTLNAPRDNLDQDEDLFSGLTLDERLQPKQKDCEANLKATKTNIKSELLAAENAVPTESITFATSKMDHWILLGTLSSLQGTKKKVLLQKMPRSFVWLLEYCSQTIGVHWSSLYEQLLVIEIMYTYGVENLNDFKDCLRYKYNIPIRMFNTLVTLYRAIW